MSPKMLSISLDSLRSQHPDAPSDLQAFDYKGNVIAVSFDTGIVYRVDKRATNSTKWNRVKDGNKKGCHTRYSEIAINGSMERLHRVIEGSRIGRYLAENDLIDHKLQVGTINYADNLRLFDANPNANNSANIRNRTHQGNSSAYGVHFDHAARKFMAYIKLSYTRLHLGRYVNESAAAFISDIFTYHLHGNHARLNDPRCIPFYKIICREFTDPYELKAYILANRLHIDRLFDGVVISREKFVELQALNK